MRDPRRCALDLLLHAVAHGGPGGARPRRARRAGGARGQPRALRGPQDQGGALPGRHNRQPQTHLQDNAEERPDQRIWPQEVQMPSRQAQRGRPAERGRQGVRRARAAHPRVQRPDLRARRRRLELRLPARRPEQPRDRRPFRRTAQGRRPGEGRLRDAGVPDIRHRGVPYGPRQRVRQREDRRDARRLRHRAVAVEEGVPVRQRGRRVDPRY